TSMTDRYEKNLKALSHEIWAAAQLAPGEGIVDGVARVEAMLRAEVNGAIRELLAERDQLSAEVEALRAELDESCAVGDKLARLLEETAIVIKGPEPDMTKWSYHDIPDGV